MVGQSSTFTPPLVIRFFSACYQVSLKLYDIFVPVLLVGEKYDEYVTSYITGGANKLSQEAVGFGF